MSAFARRGRTLVRSVSRFSPTAIRATLGIALALSLPTASAIAQEATSLQDTQDSAFTTKQLDYFETKIRPALVQNCYECHSSKSAELSGALSLEDSTGWNKGGYSGPAILPGNPDNSLLIQAIRYTGDFSDMPPAGKLPDDVISDFERWVQMGAPAPQPNPENTDSSGEQTGPDPNHWSLLSRSTPTAPKVRSSHWPADELDRFVLKKLEDANIHPTVDARPEVWLRRVYLDLVGLPPSQLDLQQFAKDPSEDHKAEIVDKLLASRAFGERWGRHWLDVVRYADSTGGGRTRLLPQAWRFRDYVIQAYNDDRPVNEMIVQHVAGDLLPADTAEGRQQNAVATGFLALGPYNYEKQDKEQLRMDVVDEQLDTIGRAFLGLTLGCARCHDHKFDAITAADYYAMAGILRNTQTLLTANVSNWVEVDLEYTREQQAEVERIAAELKTLDAEIAQLRNLASDHVKELGLLGYAPDGSYVGGIVLDDATAKRSGNWINSTSVKPYVGAGYIHDDNKRKGRKSLTFATALPHKGPFEVRLAYTHGGNRAPDVRIEIHAASGKQTVQVDQRKRPSIEGQFHSLGVFEFADHAVVTVSNADSTGYVVADAIQFLPQQNADAGGEDATPIDQDDDRLAEAQEQFARLIKQNKQLTEQIVDKAANREQLAKSVPARPKAMSVREETTVEDCALYVGGNVHRPAEIVPRGVPALLAETLEEIPAASSGRLQFAKWIAGDQNPLTARVYVNRVWLHLFGQGLVASCDNFGAMGTLPSHPELLDYLTNEFVANDWSTKSLIRGIVLSRTYGQAYADNPQAQQIDPENRLLWRANRRRVDVEVLRDTMLAVSGQLEQSRGGPAFPSGRASEFAALAARPVRSVYLPVFRNQLDPLLAAFDFGNASFVNGVRETSTRPAQALFMMNSDFLEEQTKLTGEWLANLSNDNSGRLEALYVRALSRLPTEREQAFLLRKLENLADTNRNAEDSQAQAWADIARAVFSSVDFRFVE